MYSAEEVALTLVPHLDQARWHAVVRDTYRQRLQSGSTVITCIPTPPPPPLPPSVRQSNAKVRSRSPCAAIGVPSPLRRGRAVILSNRSGSHQDLESVSFLQETSSQTFSQSVDSLDSASNDSRHRNAVKRLFSNALLDSQNAIVQGEDSNGPPCRLMIARLEKVEEQRDMLKSENRRLKREKAALLKKLEDAEKKNQVATSLQVSRIKIKLTMRGFVALGIRKALALTSAIGFPLAALVDTSRWTVTRAEIATWAMLVARSRAFHAILDKFVSRPLSIESFEQSQDSFEASCLRDFKIPQSINHIVCTTDEEDGSCLRFTLGLTEFCADATNTSIWQNSKLTGLLVTSMFLVDTSQLGRGKEARQAFTWHRTLSLGFATFALLVVGLTSLAMVCHNITL